MVWSLSSTVTVLVFATLMTTSLHSSYAIQWLALAGHEPKLYWNQTSSCRRAKAGMVSAQKKICRQELDSMEGIVEAAELTKQTCVKQFADRRWNCSSINTAPDFTPDLDKGTREAAFAYALAAAAISYSMAIECSSGAISKCGCGRTPPEEADADFHWGGCSDNVGYGMSFSARFADAPLRTKRKRNQPESLMGLHNNQAGLLTVQENMKRKCKCHGVSGSCNVKTCWQSLPEMEEIGSKLKRKYAGATEVVSEKVGNRYNLVPVDTNLKKFTEQDLIYLTNSPDYCRQNEKTGSLGTVGRFCNKTSIGNDGCDLMCCGRGYKSMVITIVEQCQCRYHWCCYVKCKECSRTAEVQVCK
ncbi:wingless-type MMTV integration site family, member 11 precursor [Saccoglossus kowalevskii]|uniref:Protein Wnt n=1 Tax=Saccoglossus kowalevskii TaxID=10224 RepID=D1LXI1_SACKO|nr:wingless-type MMTV integration site family, member 11 precursor [Saccoglossus kowalevskii]ACY92687.1 Wnt11 [Saccoglossus kowalevskii]